MSYLLSHRQISLLVSKTSLIREYVHAQPELLPLMYHGVKAWLKYEGLNDPAPTSGPRSLSSFAIKLM